MKNKAYTRRIGQEGFTLIEVLLVVVIIGILVGIAVPKFAGKVGKAQTSKAKADIKSIGLALDMFEVDNGRYPSSLDGLMTKPGNAPNWDGPYMKEGLPKDPWQNQYIYAFPGSHNPHGYDLSSMGPDGAGGGADDVKNWE